MFVSANGRVGYLSTLGTILKDNWQWRKQIGRLAIFELKKKSRGAVLSWAWFFIKPAMYIFCFWFALEVGLRIGRQVDGDAPYFLWLCAGIIPWFFMSEMIGSGCDVLHRYSYLVKKIKFPMSAISTFYVCSSMIIHVVLVGVLFILYFVSGQPLDIHLIQIVPILLLMFFFWDAFSILFSQLSGLTKDVANLMSALSTPAFWLSGVIFDISRVNIDWIQTIMLFNPVTFFAKAYRAAFYYRTWFWEDPMVMLGFAVVFFGTVVFMVLAYRKLNTEVADVL